MHKEDKMFSSAFYNEEMSTAASVEQRNVVHVSEIFYVTRLNIETIETLLVLMRRSFSFLSHHTPLMSFLSN